MCHDLTPEEAHQVLRRSVREHAAGDQDFRLAIVIEIMTSGSPSPTAELSVLLKCGIFERAVAAIAIERIAARVPSICVMARGRLCRSEPRAPHDSLTSIGPHIGYV